MRKSRLSLMIELNLAGKYGEARKQAQYFMGGFNLNCWLGNEEDLQI